MGIKGFGKKLNADNQEIDSDRLCERFKDYGFASL